MRRVVIGILAVTGAVTIVALIAGAVYLSTMIRRGFSARDEPMAVEKILARTLRRWSVPQRAHALLNPLKPTADVLAGGRAHWADHCYTCHANDGSGGTSIGKSLYPRAPDMRLGDTQRLSDGELYYIIRNGIRLTGMPAWGGPSEDDPESWALVAFIRHLPSLTRDELLEMERLNPKGPEDIQEEKDEDAFLNGAPVAPSTAGAQTHGHSHGSTK